MSDRGLLLFARGAGGAVDVVPKDFVTSAVTPLRGSAEGAADHAGSPPLASIWVDASDRTTVLAAAGEIDMSNQEEFRAALATAAADDRRLVVDLTRVTTLSSHAIGVLYRHAGSLTAVYVAHNSLIARALSCSGFASRVPVIADPRVAVPAGG